MVVGDLLGPAGGENEELYERNVRDRYLVGVLAPASRTDDLCVPSGNRERTAISSLPQSLPQPRRALGNLGQRLSKWQSPTMFRPNCCLAP